jgi:ABC-type amino acid transport substrate-binding protein
MDAPDPTERPVHPMLTALANAPVVQWLTPEQRAELDQAMADLAAGRVKMVAHDDVPAYLESLARAEQGG